MKHLESNTQIYFTTEYGELKFLKGNRDINASKVEKIIKDVKSGIDLFKYAPIIVNENMEIIDGQHRFAAARALKVNVYYVIMQADLSIVPSINSKGSRWRTVDFLNSYVDLKKENYVDLQNFIKTYERISLPIAIRLFHTGKSESDKDSMDAFQDGELSNKFRGEAHKYSTILCDFIPFTDNPFSQRMFQTIMQIHGNGKYNHELMIKKLNDSSRRIEDLKSAKTIIQNMESIINYKSKTRIIIN